MEKTKLSDLKNKSNQNVERFRSKLKKLSRNTLRSFSNPRSSSAKANSKRKISNYELSSSSSSRSVSPSKRGIVFSVMTRSNMSDGSHEKIELNSIKSKSKENINLDLKKLDIANESVQKTPVPHVPSPVIMRRKPYNLSPDENEYFTCQTSFNGFLNPVTPTRDRFYGLHFSQFDSINSRDSISSLTSISSWTSASMSYEFTTLDKESIETFGIEVKPINQRATGILEDYEHSGSNDSHFSIIYQESIQDLIKVHWSLADLSKKSIIFNQNNFGLTAEIRKSKTDPSESFLLGTVRIYINLLRPITMELSPRPSSIFDVLGYNNIINDTCSIQHAQQENIPKSETFWLPRGSSKRLFVSQCTPTSHVINGILNKFHIKVDPYKFGLYEHIIEGDRKVVVRKLDSTECPLATMLTWTVDGVDKMNEIMSTRRLVLQENETGDIDWHVFSRPELDNFMRILDREESEARGRITLKYQILRAEINRLHQSTMSSSYL